MLAADEPAGGERLQQAAGAVRQLTQLRGRADLGRWRS